MRFVFDTNVLVSGLMFRQSKPRLAFNRARQVGVVLTSTAAFFELSNTLRRRKLAVYIEEDERVRFLDEFARNAEHVEIHEIISLCRDPKDDKMLELASSGHADFLVSGDKDLLVLARFRNIEILTPAALIDRLQPT